MIDRKLYLAGLSYIHQVVNDMVVETTKLIAMLFVTDKVA